MTFPSDSAGFSQRGNPPSYIRLRCASIAQAQMVDTEGRGFQLPDGRVVNRVRLIGTVVFQRIFEPDTEQETSEVLDSDRPPRKRYGVLVIDDGTEVVTVKAWGDNVRWYEPIESGDSADVFGRLNLYRGEMSVIADLVVKVNDIKTEILRDLQLLMDEKSLGARPGGPSRRQITQRSGFDSQSIRGLTEFTGSSEDTTQPFAGETPLQTEETKTEDQPAKIDKPAKTEQEIKEHVELRGKVLNAIVVLDVEGTGVSREEVLDFIGSISSQQMEETLARLIEDGDVYMPRRNVFRKV